MPAGGTKRQRGRDLLLQEGIFTRRFMMLVLTRKVGDEIRIDDHITVKIMAVEGTRVRVGLDAPANVPIVRGELLWHDTAAEAPARSWKEESLWSGSSTPISAK